MHKADLTAWLEEKCRIVTPDGELLDVPPEGSLGLLALGANGLIAWRKKRHDEAVLSTENQTDKRA